MANMVFEMQATIKRNSDDLREELNDLARWEDDIKGKSSKKTASSSSSGGVAITATDDLPPIRGTAPLVKPKTTPKEDPLLKAKEEGNEYYRRNQYDDALRSYSKGITVDPTDSATHILYANRAMCYLKLSLWEKAESDATTCIQMNRTYFKAFFRRALARRSQGKLEEAASDLQTVLVLSPSDPESQKELKLINAELQKKRDAAQKKSGGGGAVQPVKKKLVIEEVDDDEEDEEEEKKQREKAEREAAARRETQKLEAEKARKKAEHEKAVEAAKKKVKANPKIEELDDEEEETPKRAAPAKKAASPPVVVPRKLQVVITPESLTTPKSFTEFEKTYNDIGKTKDPSLLPAYAKKLPLSTLPQLMGSSMSSEILVDLLKIVRDDDDRAFAKEFLVALSTIRRLDEVVMFFEADEKKILEQAVASVDGLPANIKSKFQ